MNMMNRRYYLEDEFRSFVFLSSYFQGAGGTWSQTTDANCLKNLTSFSNSKRISLILYLIIACLSIPIPHAKPEYLFESIPHVSNTAGSTIPHPMISNQPVPFVIR